MKLNKIPIRRFPTIHLIINRNYYGDMLAESVFHSIDNQIYKEALNSDTPLEDIWRLLMNIKDSINDHIKEYK